MVHNRMHLQVWHTKIAVCSWMHICNIWNSWFTIGCTCKCGTQRQQSAVGCLCIQEMKSACISTGCCTVLLGGSGRVINSLDFYSVSFKSLGPVVAAVTFCNFLHKQLQSAFTHTNQLHRNVNCKWTFDIKKIMVCSFMQLG